MNHEHHNHHDMVEEFKNRFWINSILSIPILLLSVEIQHLLHYSLSFSGDVFVLVVLSTVIYFYGGLPFMQGFFTELKALRFGMMTLIALAITIAYTYSVAVVFGLKGKSFFWELATLIDVMLLGHWIEMRSVMGASKALEKLAALMPSIAHLLMQDNSLKDIAITDLKKEDKVVVKPGEKIPVDGVILAGDSEVNEAALTGESKPVFKSIGINVIGGSINGTGSLTIQVKNIGKDSYIAQVIKMVQEAMKSKSRVADIANTTAAWLTIIAIGVGLSTFLIWNAIGKPLAFSIERMVTVMVVTCPHALGLAIPLVIACITSIAASKGLVIRNRVAFEQAKDLNVIVFDKTGTLTTGIFEVSDIVSLGDWSEEKLITYAAALEEYSKHSIASSIVQYAKNKKFSIPKVISGKTIPGKGTTGIVENIELFVGNEKLLDDIGLYNQNLKISEKGKTVVFVATKQQLLGVIGLSDQIREQSYKACIQLKQMGYSVAMITGDNKFIANAVAKKLNIDIVLSDVLPDKKASEIKKLQVQGKKVAMIGDGINDAPALVQADIGIAIGAGTDIAIESADVVLVKNDPFAVVDIIKLSKITQRKMVQNLIWATGYNVVAIPLAAGALYNQGIILHPAIGALIMSISTIVVAINSRLIKY